MEGCLLELNAHLVSLPLLGECLEPTLEPEWKVAGAPCLCRSCFWFRPFPLQMEKLTLLGGGACLRCHSWAGADLGTKPRLASSLASAVITLWMFPTSGDAGNRGLKDQLAPFSRQGVLQPSSCLLPSSRRKEEKPWTNGNQRISSSCTPSRPPPPSSGIGNPEEGLATALGRVSTC